MYKPPRFITITDARDTRMTVPTDSISCIDYEPDGDGDARVHFIAGFTEEVLYVTPEEAERLGYLLTGLPVAA